jgi:hypothetical protein
MRTVSRSRPAKVRTAAGFLDQESGSVTIFAIVGFAMCMVIAGLVFDVGRVMGIHTQIKSFADRMALAAAAELDGRPGALARAVNITVGPSSPIGEGHRFTLGDDDSLNIQRIVFLSALGPEPADPATPSPVPGDVRTARWTSDGGLVLEGGRTAAQADQETRFVVIEPEAEQENYVLFPLMAWLAPDMATQATVASQAVAGYRQNICNSPPIMLCNPAEASTLGAPFTFNRFQQIRARIRTGSGSLNPGDIKVLNTPDSLTTGNQREYTGLIESNTFCSGARIPIRDETSLAGIRDGLNTRFDMFTSALFSERNSGDYTPAPRAPKGFQTTVSGSSCSVDKSTNSTPLPRDNCFMPGRPPGGNLFQGVPSGVAGTGCTSSIQGNGAWDRAAYWAINHSGVPQPAGYNSMSRYDVYRNEVTRGLNTSENRCSTSPSNRTTNALRDRRVIPIAIVNCRSVQTSGDRDNIPVIAYAEAFLTEPVGAADSDLRWWNGDSDDVFMEILGTARPDLPETVQREYPVLVR